jgi:hypothetical protein
MQFAEVGEATELYTINVNVDEINSTKIDDLANDLWLDYKPLLYYTIKIFYLKRERQKKPGCADPAFPYPIAIW